MPYKLLMWGFVFLINIRVGSFDVLPDIIGYYLILHGLHILKKNNKYFIKSRNVVVVIITIYALSLIRIMLSGDYLELNSFIAVFYIANKIAAFMTWPLLYLICGGLIFESRESNNYRLESYIMAKINIVIFLWFLYLLTFFLSISSIVPIVLSAVVHIIMVLIMYKSSKGITTMYYF